jgi:imidazole glycerol phosphate synthase subunit HisF
MKIKSTNYKAFNINKNNNKYNAKKTYIDGICFASKLESHRYGELMLLQKAGQIKELRWQVPFILFENNKYGHKVEYRADFTYKQNDELVVEDVKSSATKTPLYKLKKRILAEKYGIEIKEVY